MEDVMFSLHSRLRPRTAILLITLIALGGCASSSGLVNMWKDPNYPREPMTNVLVVALKKDPVMRRVWEDGFGGQLAKHQTKATTSYTLFPSALPDTQQVIAAVGEHGFDGVLVVRRLDATTESHYVSGYTTVEPVSYLNPWTGLYSTYYQRVVHPGYTETQERVSYETHVWSTKDGGRLVWAGTSETIDPSSSEEVNHEITRLIVPELADKGVIPKD
jgi:hypothetical protein